MAERVVYSVYDGVSDDSQYFWSKRAALQEARRMSRIGPPVTVWVQRCTISPDLRGRALILALLNREGVMSEQTEIATITGDAQ